jgi:predicted transcriptional regulator
MAGLSQSQLATAAGMSKTGLANIENGQVDPRVSTMDSIQKALEAAGAQFLPEGAVRLRAPFR